MPFSFTTVSPVDYFFFIAADTESIAFRYALMTLPSILIVQFWPARGRSVTTTLSRCCRSHSSDTPRPTVSLGEQTLSKRHASTSRALPVVRRSLPS